jgi:hypothetical protein
VRAGEVLGATQSYYATTREGEIADVQRFCRYSAPLEQDDRTDDCIVTFDSEGTFCQDSWIPDAGDPQRKAVDECPRNRNPDHLHLEVFIARGSDHGTNAIRINPLLMFSADLVTEFTRSLACVAGQRPALIFDPYFPIDGDNYDECPQPLEADTLGLLRGDLYEFSQRNDLGDNVPGYGFFDIQTPTPMSVPEWWLDTLGEPDRVITELEDFLFTYGYPPAGIPYVGPNCINAPLSNIPAYPATCEVDGRNDLNFDPLNPTGWPFQ